MAAVDTTTTSPPLKNKKLKKQISQPAVKRKWLPGNFCSTHDHGVWCDHNSKSCGQQANGYITTTTSANPTGPDAN